MEKIIDRQQIQTDICIIISQILEDEYKRFDEDYNLFNDIGIDSIGYLELTIQIQRLYQINITHEEWSDIQKLKDAVDVVIAKIQEDGKI